MRSSGDINPTPYFIGTSGWTYDHWKGSFYPPGLTKNRWFDHYAGFFNAVEINATFYRSFGDQTYVKWKARAPQGFGYVIKTPKVISHLKMLRDVDGDIQAFEHSVRLLGDTFQMILLQVPPNLPYDPGRLKSALQAFRDPSHVAVEFRNGRWYNPQIEGLLASTETTFCNVDSPGQALTEILTSSRAYIRLHGREKWYASDYSPEILSEIADRARRLVDREAKQVFIFFNNDFGGFAPINAMTLQGLLNA